MGVGGHVDFKVEIGNRVDTLHLDEIYRKEGTPGVVTMLRNYKPDGHPNYAQYYASFYDGYSNAEHFQQNRKAAEYLRDDWMRRTHKPAAAFDF